MTRDILHRNGKSRFIAIANGYKFNHNFGKRKFEEKTKNDRLPNPFFMEVVVERRQCFSNDSNWRICFKYEIAEMKKKKIISFYTENNIGLLNRISAIFLKRHTNIDTINSSPLN